MLLNVAKRKRRQSPKGSARSSLGIEALEARNLLSSGLGPTIVNETEVNDTILTAEDFGAVPIDGLALGNGSVGNGAAGPADVDFYRFTLAQPARIQSELTGALQGVLSLYREDPFSLSGFQLIAQADGTTLDIDLAAGTYFIAASGQGNRYFHPFLANSGYHGATGNYQLRLLVCDPGIAVGDGPRILNSNPGQGTVLSSSPLALRLGVSESLTPATLIPGLTVNLLSSPDGTFGDGNDVPVFLVSANYQALTSELVVTPFAPLAPGFYQLTLFGDEVLHSSVIRGIDASPLGLSLTQPNGEDFVLTFEINGSEGVVTPVAQANDTDDTAQDLGDVTDTGLVQTTGAIGDDPSDFFPFNPSDVDIYRFTVSGPGQYAFTAEIFAGRIGSTLSSALTLFGRQDPLDPNSPLIFLASNGGTQNVTLAENFTIPLFDDAALYSGLTEGEYFLAVSSAFNYPDQFFPPGTGGVFDPSISHSGFVGFSSGEYVLNLLVEPVSAPPQVVSVSIGANATLAAPPLLFTVEFDSTVNLQQLSFDAFQTTFTGAISSVFVQDGLAQQYFPRLQSYDETTNVATFLLLDPVPNGPAELHLAGTPPFGTGVTDLAGNPLVGNDPSGDFVVPFTIAGPPRGSLGDPTLWFNAEPNDSLAAAQLIGPLFPNELVGGVTIERTAPGAGASDTQDFFLIEVGQSQQYLFSLTQTSGLPPGTVPEITDANGNPIGTIPQGPTAVLATLPPGQYVVRVGGWAAGAAPGVSYKLITSMLGSPEQPTALTSGPAPALQIRLAGSSLSPTGSSGVPQVLLPSSSAFLISTPGIDPAIFLVNGGASGSFGDTPSGMMSSLSAGPVGGGGINGNGTFSQVDQAEFQPSSSQSPDVVVASLFNLFIEEEAEDAKEDPGSTAPEEEDASLILHLKRTLSRFSNRLGDWLTGSHGTLDELFENWKTENGLDRKNFREGDAVPTPAPGSSRSSDPFESLPVEQVGRRDSVGTALLAVSMAAALAPGAVSRPRRRERKVT